MELLSDKIDMTPLCFLNEFLAVDAAVTNTVVMEMPYKFCVNSLSTNASVPGDGAPRVTVRIRMQEDFVYILAKSHTVIVFGNFRIA